MRLGKVVSPDSEGDLRVRLRVPLSFSIENSKSSFSVTRAGRGLRLEIGLWYKNDSQDP